MKCGSDSPLNDSAEACSRDYLLPELGSRVCNRHQHQPRRAGGLIGSYLTTKILQTSLRSSGVQPLRSSHLGVRRRVCKTLHLPMGFLKTATRRTSR